MKVRWPDTAGTLETINQWFLDSFRHMPADHAEPDAPLDLGDLLRAFLKKAQAEPLANDRHIDDAFMEFYWTARSFLAVFDAYGEGHATLFSGSGSTACVTLSCLDPAESLSQALDMDASCVFFSATLSPAHYYRRMFGMGNTDPDLAMPSPFDPDHLGVMVMDSVSTLYRDRQQTAPLVAEALLAQYASRPGKYLFFFPSYQYLSNVYEHFRFRAPFIRSLVQERSMGERERDRFLQQFEQEGGLAGFAVLGGVFAEGVDLAGELLHGAAIVGVGLPPVSPRLSLIREHFERRDESGYHYAFTYPGMTRVLQAAGRIIRTEHDRGTLLLLDSRWQQAHYQELMPAHWQPQWVEDAVHLGELCVDFWQE